MPGEYSPNRLGQRPSPASAEDKVIRVQVGHNDGQEEDRIPAAEIDGSVISILTRSSDDLSKGAEHIAEPLNWPCFTRTPKAFFHSPLDLVSLLQDIVPFGRCSGPDRPFKSRGTSIMVNTPRNARRPHPAGQPAQGAAALPRAALGYPVPLLRWLSC